VGDDRALLMDRRKVLTLLGGVGLGALAAACGTRSGSSGTTTTSDSGSATGTQAYCILTPEMTEGPYYLDVNMVRSDITEGKTGTPLTLDLTVVDATTCAPIKDAAVDVWHADAEGVYSGFGGASTGGNPPGLGAPPTGGPGGPGGPGGGGGQQSPTDDKTFLRGIQITDANGKAQFKTIYPGWYQGRTVHIHVKVSTGGNEVHTGQLFFPESISNDVFDGGVYSSRGDADTSNENDNIFADGGKESTLKIARNGDGYTGSLMLGVQQS
jgi:protocatechuate 3,4-dioxygenase beta subunit